MNLSNSFLSSPANSTDPPIPQVDLWDVASVKNISHIFAGRKTEVVTWLTVTFTVAIFGIVMNAAALIGAWPNSARRSSFNVLLCHFIALHLWMCLINFPINAGMVVAALHGYKMSEYLCDDINIIWGVTVTMINWSDAGLAFNRCIALFFPLKYAAWSTMRINVGMIAGSYVICLGSRYGAILASRTPTNLMMFKLNPMGLCTPLATGTNAATQVYIALTVTVPYSLTGLGALLILFKSTMMSRKRRQTGPAKIELTPQMRQRMKMARMLLLTFLWTLICMLPTTAVYTLAMVVVKNLTVSVLWLRIVWPFQYSIVPCILLLSNLEYRRRFTEVFGKAASFVKSHATHSTGSA